jgi:CO dehydrogenase nickel-insertion accessory protein CooC1
MNARPLSGLRIGIFGKGGAGKSTVAVFLARALRERGYTVLVLDADSTNLGLAEALGVEGEPAPLLDHFGGMVFSGGQVTCPVDDPTPLEGADLRLAELPPRFVRTSPEGVHLLEAGKLGGLGPGAGCDGPVAKIARDVRVRDVGPVPVTLIDFKAGFEDAARGALTSVDWALVAVDPTTAAVRMAKHLARTVADIRRGVPPATRHLESGGLSAIAVRLFAEARVRGVLAVLDRLRTPLAAAFLRETLESEGIPVVGAFDDIPCVAEQWMRGEPLRSRTLAEAADALAADLEAVTQRALAASASVDMPAPGERASFADVPGPDPEAASPFAYREDGGERMRAEEETESDVGATYADVRGPGAPR